MRFSIIIPVFNAEGTLRRCLESIMNQTSDNYEVILINDGSTDRTLEVALEVAELYAQKHSNMKIYSFENAGVSVARQRGIFYASGDYIIFVDADDTINQDLLRELQKATDENPDIVRFKCELVGDNPSKNHDRYNFDTTTAYTGVEVLKEWSLSGRRYAVYWLYAFKTSILKKISFPTIKCYEDVAVIPIIILSAFSVVTIDFVGYYYTYNSNGSLTNKHGLAEERSRAFDFAFACKYAIEYFRKNLSEKDFEFFYRDYKKRLQEKYKSLPDSLQKELKDLFEI